MVTLLSRSEGKAVNKAAEDLPFRHRCRGVFGEGGLLASGLAPQHVGHRCPEALPRHRAASVSRTQGKRISQE